MRLLIIGFILTATAFGQPGKLGLFTNSTDVGDPATKGSTLYDAATGQYKITGATESEDVPEDEPPPDPDAK